MAIFKLQKYEDLICINDLVISCINLKHKKRLSESVLNNKIYKLNIIYFFETGLHKPSYVNC